MKSFHEWNFWKRHANYLSGWTRLASYPLLISSGFFRDWKVVGAVVIFLIINPILFPRPKSYKYWMSKGVLGEQLWVKNKLQHSKAAKLNILSAISFIVLLFGLYYQWPYTTIIFGTASGVFKLLFIEEMVVYYDEQK